MGLSLYEWDWPRGEQAASKAKLVSINKQKFWMIQDLEPIIVNELNNLAGNFNCRHSSFYSSKQALLLRLSNYQPHK